MKKVEQVIARVGMVNFINTAPIHEVWKEQVKNRSWQLIEEHPAALNEMLANGQIDLGFVSSHEYGMRPERYRILADLSISANGPVGSVFLFSRIKPEKLSGLPVLLSSQSKTSVCLVKIILDQFFNVTPIYLEGDVREARSKNVEGVLAIGDDAIRLNLEGSYQYVLDLGEAWLKLTGLPFVFAICAVREEFAVLHQEQTNEIHRSLIDCRDKGIADLSRICSIAAPRIPMEISSCHSYLKGIEYNLDDNKEKALTTFFTYLVGINEASEKALPLKIQHLT